MRFTWRRVTLGAIGVVYLTGAGVLAGVTSERVRADRERVAVVRAAEQRKREVRARVMRVELKQEAGRAASRSR